MLMMRVLVAQDPTTLTTGAANGYVAGQVRAGDVLTACLLGW